MNEQLFWHPRFQKGVNGEGGGGNIFHFGGPRLQIRNINPSIYLYTRVGKKVNSCMPRKIEKWTEQNLLETTLENLFLDVRSQEIEALS